MSKNIGISKRYLLSIAKNLKDCGYIDVSMGPGGGYFLAKEPDEISLYDVIAQMEGTIIISPSQLQQVNNEGEPCILHEAYSFLQSILECYLRSLTIDMLIEQPHEDLQSTIIEVMHKKHCKKINMNARPKK